MLPGDHLPFQVKVIAERNHALLEGSITAVSMDYLDGNTFWPAVGFQIDRSVAENSNFNINIESQLHRTFIVSFITRRHRLYHHITERCKTRGVKLKQLFGGEILQRLFPAGPGTAPEL